MRVSNKQLMKASSFYWRPNYSGLQAVETHTPSRDERPLMDDAPRLTAEGDRLCHLVLGQT